MKNRLTIGTLVLLAFLVPSLAMAHTPSGQWWTGAAGANTGSCNQDNVTRTAPPPSLQAVPANAFQTAYDYLVTFYPRWFTYYQADLPSCNVLLGPVRVTPLYRIVVAINVDTLYASAFVGVKHEPVIVTVPSTRAHYSVLQLDQYGSVIDGIPSNQPGVYALTGPDWHGTLPDGVTQETVPYDITTLIFRADKYTDGQDLRRQAKRFRRNLHIAPLSVWRKDHNAGPTRIVPVAYYAAPFKGVADRLATKLPIRFLQMLQTAVLDSATQPLTADEQSLSDAFNALLSDRSQWPTLRTGARAAHAAILANYHNTTFPGTTWITFTDMGVWDSTPQGYLNRSSIMEYIQFGNNHSAAAYYQTFLDTYGDPLDGTSHAYVLTFPNGGQPQVSRFWSLTAYVPGSIELVRNAARKYVVASYTPGLVTNSDGSVTIMMSVVRPPNFPEANWLPVPKGKFNVMLRAYGPEGSVVNNTYVPPPVDPLALPLLRAYGSDGSLLNNTYVSPPVIPSATP